MRVCAIVVLTRFVALGCSNSSDVAPQIIYGTYLAGRIRSARQQLLSMISETLMSPRRTPSADFPVTAGAFSTTTSVNNDDWVGQQDR
jgi:hypothetical protein